MMTDDSVSQMAVHRRWVVFYLATVFAMMTMQMSSLGFSPLLPDIQREFEMSFSQMGMFTGFYGIECFAAGTEHFPGVRIGRLSKIPGGNNDLVIFCRNIIHFRTGSKRLAGQHSCRADEGGL